MGQVSGKLMGQWSGKTKAIANVPNAERVVVDSTALHCPICLSLFLSTPVVLPCGHSFCETCIRRLIETSFEIHNNIYQPTYECALCRTKCSCDAPLTKNFAVEALLQSVDDIAASEFLPESDINLRTSYKRIAQKLAQSETMISQLRKKLEVEMKRNRNLCFAVVVLGSLLSASAAALIAATT